MSDEKNDQPQDTLRPHVFDGDIQEYDNRMPNWWLGTLYGAIIFSFVYWSFYHRWDFTDEPGTALEKQMKANAELVAQSSGVVTDDDLWDMSKDPAILASGRTTFMTTCAPCHKEDLSGNIGPNLKRQMWIHGGNPTEIVKTITEGVPAKGMLTWGPVLGKKKINEVAAFILSFHKKGEPIEKAPPWVPGAASNSASVTTN